jgi:uncharacterized protein (DUF58 family)
MGLLLIWGAVAHASGSGWVQALGALAAGIALVGMLGPYLALSRLDIDIEAVPEEAVRGECCRLRVLASSSCQLTPLRPGGKTAELPGGEVTYLDLFPEHRGTLRAIEVEVSSAAPFGLLWWTGRRRLELGRKLVVMPARAPSGQPAAEGESIGENTQTSRLAETGERRGSRPYRVGDSPRKVDWRATGHTGTLMVRESDVSLERPAVVRASLPPDLDAAEEVASRLFATVAGLLEAGRSVLIETGGDNPERTPVVSHRQAGRLLALIGTNPWGDLGEAAK